MPRAVDHPRHGRSTTGDLFDRDVAPAIRFGAYHVNVAAAINEAENSAQQLRNLKVDQIEARKLREEVDFRNEQAGKAGSIFAQVEVAMQEVFAAREDLSRKRVAHRIEAENVISGVWPQAKDLFDGHLDHVMTENRQLREENARLKEATGTSVAKANGLDRVQIFINDGREAKQIRKQANEDEIEDGSLRKKARSSRTSMQSQIDKLEAEVACEKDLQRQNQLLLDNSSEQNREIERLKEVTAKLKQDAINFRAEMAISIQRSNLRAVDQLGAARLKYETGLNRTATLEAHITAVRRLIDAIRVKSKDNEMPTDELEKLQTSYNKYRNDLREQTLTNQTLKDDLDKAMETVYHPEDKLQSPRDSTARNESTVFNQMGQLQQETSSQLDVSRRQRLDGRATDKQQGQNGVPMLTMSNSRNSDHEVGSHHPLSREEHQTHTTLRYFASSYQQHLDPNDDTLREVGTSRTGFTGTSAVATSIGASTLPTQEQRASRVANSSATLVIGTGMSDHNLPLDNLESIENLKSSVTGPQHLVLESTPGPVLSLSSSSMSPSNTATANGVASSSVNITSASPSQSADPVQSTGASAIWRTIDIGARVRVCRTEARELKESGLPAKIRKHIYAMDAKTKSHRQTNADHNVDRLRCCWMTLFKPDKSWQPPVPVPVGKGLVNEKKVAWEANWVDQSVECPQCQHRKAKGEEIVCFYFSAEDTNQIIAFM
ncbi:hypothetical protein PVAG01_00170 [Phlyctema vagabunda]|uniref:Uncharacterized protein n=1 Tax=Phlyctema vagabunda TaxID=108571 RepID=A0ABR4PTK7_9HELO